MLLMRLLTNCPCCGTVNSTGEVYCEKCSEPIYKEKNLYSQYNNYWSNSNNTEVNRGMKV